MEKTRDEKIVHVKQAWMLTIPESNVCIKITHNSLLKMIMFQGKKASRFIEEGRNPKTVASSSLMLDYFFPRALLFIAVLACLVLPS